MPKTYDIDGIIVNLVNPNLGIGGQGHAQQVALSNDPSIGLVVKHLPMSHDAQKRTKFLVEQSLPLLSPYLAAPIAVNLDDKNEILHLAPFAAGHDLLSDARTLPENMEIGLILSGLLTLLEENGIAHGDIGPSNIITTQDGAVYLIDFDNFACTDTDIPPPTMRGQHGMMAPELLGENGNIPNLQSDRFAYGVIFSLLLMRRHPAAQAQVPTDAEMILSSGIWPERNMPRRPDDVPVEALGIILTNLFDAAFLTDPTQRPSADEWRRGFTDALHDMVIHDCGNAFVLIQGQTQCPWCGVNIEGDILPRISQLKITISSTQARYNLNLQDGQPIILGRSNLGAQATHVSGQHLEITPMGDRIFLRHIGRNPTHMLKNGTWYNRKTNWIDLDDIANAPITLKLADLHIDIGI